MLPDPASSPTSPAASGVTVEDLLEALDGFAVEERHVLTRALLARVSTDARGIPARQRTPLSRLLFALATIAITDVALAELDVTPENAGEVLDTLRKLHTGRDMAERQAASLVGSITPATIAGLLANLSDLLREARAQASPGTSLH